MFRTLCFVAFSALLLVGCGRDNVEVALNEITADRLKEHVARLSDDLMEGRGPATRGDSLATQYILDQYRSLGLTPSGENGGYLQKVPIVGTTIDHSAILEIKKGGQVQRLKFSDDFVAFTGTYQPTVTVSNADLVFVGYGIVAPEQGWDDYKDVDVRGKVLLMMNNDPAGDDPNFFGGKARMYYGRWTYKYEIAAKKGAVGAIVIHTTESAGYPYQVVQTSWSRENFDLASDGGDGVKLKAWTTEDATKKYLAMAGLNLEELMKRGESKSFKPIPLGLKVSTTMKYRIRTLETNNILGVLEGSDPELKSQYIVFSAHHDHLGIGEPVDGDSINNGALDNASGVSLMLNLARSFAAMPEKPKRSLLFAAVGAEESGLLGSKHFAQNPTVPVKEMAANINTDGLNIWGRTNDIAFLGWDRSTLKQDVDAVAAEMNMQVKPDPFPEKGYFYRSDHFNFAKVGVPCLSMESGTDYVGKPADYAKQMVETYTEKNYHQPSDELTSDWNFDGGIQQAEFIVRLTMRIANNPAMPAWNKGDEFEAAR
ncbi:MAG: M28 family peptidase [Ignavibacteriae bacterium]|nr:M28 family peptidase [Ignavibacteriota bacterium]